MKIITFTFDDLPVHIGNDIEAGLLAGEAIIEYNSPEDWWALNIYLYGKIKGKHYYNAYELPRHNSLYSVLRDRLEDKWHYTYWYDSICKAIESEINYQKTNPDNYYYDEDAGC